MGLEQKTFDMRNGKNIAAHQELTYFSQGHEVRVHQQLKEPSSEKEDAHPISANCLADFLQRIPAARGQHESRSVEEGTPDLKG